MVRKLFISEEKARLQKVASDSRKNLTDEIDPGSKWRQLGAVFVINLVTFLQGASLSTSSISLVQFATEFNETLTDEQKSELVAPEPEFWPKDFKLSNLEETLISKFIKFIKQFIFCYFDCLVMIYVEKLNLLTNIESAIRIPVLLLFAV